MELNYGLFFLQAELASLDVGPQVVSPPQPATLPASLQTYEHDYKLNSLVPDLESSEEEARVFSVDIGSCFCFYQL